MIKSFFIFPFITLIILQGCRQANTTVSLQEYYTLDSLGKGESFSVFYDQKLKSFKADTFCTRIFFPFKVSEILENTQDWKTTEYKDLNEFKQAGQLENIRKKVSYAIPYDSKYERVFANTNRKDQNLKISFFQKSDYIQSYFINIDGRWFIKAFYELPVSENGTVPMEE